MSDRTQRMGPGTGMWATDAGGALVVRRVLVRVVSGPDRGAERVLEVGTLVLGSHPDADLPLTDSTVSRYHAELSLLPEGVRVRDLRSTNGTFVADSRIESAIVAPGSEIRVGRTRIEILPADVPVPEAPSERVRFGRLVGASAPMRRLYAQLERVAATSAPVLIYGEPGTGKSEAARAVHEASDRQHGPYVELDLRGGIAPEALDESFVRAHGGTVVLDHVDEAPAPLQDALASVLDRRERGRYDVRPISIARTDLRSAIEGGLLRRDLWFALAGIRIEVPPLRERREDLPRLVADLIASLGYPDVGLSASELATLRAHDFPGNVRELRRMIEQTLLTSERRSQAPLPPDVAVTEDLVQLPFKEAKERLLDVFEKHYVESLLARHDGNVSRAASEAGVDRNHLARLAKKHGLR
ncbi:MAG TPA: sigma 54-interacting transcriptional regulator [Sandaracinaceae bacterium]